MTRTIALTLFALFAMVSCKSNRPSLRDHQRMSSASVLTDRYAHSRLSRWNLRGSAAGPDCGVLFIEASIIMEDSMVEALHYGAGAYDVYRGGVQQFSRERTFRAVAYRDRSGHVWTFGDITPTEAVALPPCS